MIAVLDQRGLDRCGAPTLEAQQFLAELRAATSDIVTSAAVLAEGVMTGRQRRDYAMSRLIAAVRVLSVDKELGLSAGRLRQRALRAGDPKLPPSAVDAIVAALALDLAPTHDEVAIVTSDRADMELLLTGEPLARRITLIR